MSRRLSIMSLMVNGLAAKALIHQGIGNWASMRLIICWFLVRIQAGPPGAINDGTRVGSIPFALVVGVNADFASQRESRLLSGPRPRRAVWMHNPLTRLQRRDGRRR